MSEFQIIRTLKELEELDPDAVLIQHQKGYLNAIIDYQHVWIENCYSGSRNIFPLVEVATGAQVRAAREAIEQEHGL